LPKIRFVLPLAAAVLAANPAALRSQSGAIVGRVVQLDTAAAGVCVDGCPLAEAAVHVVRSGSANARETMTIADGSFRLDSLTPGVYTLTARRLGYRGAELPGIRVAAGQTLRLQIRLTRGPRRLSSVEVLASPLSIDAMTTELPIHLSREYTELLPTARDASSLVSLVPGALGNQLWGGAPGAPDTGAFDWYDLNNPGIISIPLGFLGCIAGTLLSSRREEERTFDELYVRSETGLGAEKADEPERVLAPH
jgi:hypothetical protein